MIPKSFSLAGLKIDVTLDPNLFQNRKILGEAQYTKQRIVLDSSVLSKELGDQNFYHELVHWILYVMNENELMSNEKFVDLFAFMLHQAMKTGTEKYSQVEEV